MDVFTPKYAPDQGLEQDQSPRIIGNSDFALSYPQSAPDGLNPLLSSTSPSWGTLDQANGDYIVNFMRAHYGQAFLWTLPGDPAPRKWLCTGVKRAYMTSYSSVTIDLQERFDRG